MGLLSWFHLNDPTIMLVSLTLLLLVVRQWWRDIGREGRAQGLHTAVVELGLR